MDRDRFLPAGTKVRLDALVDEDGNRTAEYGVVVHCWLSDEIHACDCYVAFFGAGFPDGAPEERPYVLRYAAASLTAVAD